MAVQALWLVATAVLIKSILALPWISRAYVKKKIAEEIALNIAEESPESVAFIEDFFREDIIEQFSNDEINFFCELAIEMKDEFVEDEEYKALLEPLILSMSQSGKRKFINKIFNEVMKNTSEE